MHNTTALLVLNVENCRFNVIIGFPWGKTLIQHNQLGKQDGMHSVLMRKPRRTVNLVMTSE